MAHLHEVLAVEGDLRKTASTVREEAIGVFKNKIDLFTEIVTETKYFEDEDAAKLDGSETSAMTTTVQDKLDWIGQNVAKYLDAYLQKETTNQSANADVVVDNVVLLKNVPVTALLGMEQILKELRDLFIVIPTLKPGPVWIADEDRGKGVYRARDAEVNYITKKTIRPVILSPATDKHPAQIEKVPEDTKIAKKSKYTWSGVLSVADKAELLDRLDNLIQAFKQARQRANNAEVANVHMGKVVFDYLYQKTT
jgi:hypothetical protein